MTLCLAVWHIFMWQSLLILNIFNALNLKHKDFWKTKLFLAKLEYPFLVESTNIESTLFLWKIVLLKANVKKKHQYHEMAIDTQTIRQQIDNEFFECVWPFVGLALKGFRQIKWWVKDWLITKNAILLPTTLFFWKFNFSLRTSYK